MPRKIRGGKTRVRRERKEWRACGFERLPWNAIADGANSAPTCAPAQRHQLGIDDKEAATPGNGAHTDSLAYKCGGLRDAIRRRVHARRAVRSAAKAAVAHLIGTDGAQEVNLAKGRPQHIRKVELTVHALPKQEA
jgi:hypothetical protein